MATHTPPVKRTPKPKPAATGSRYENRFGGSALQKAVLALLDHASVQNPDLKKRMTEHKIAIENDVVEVPAPAAATEETPAE